jgi:hypothetical protein
MRQIAAYELIEKNMTENSFEIIADCGGYVPVEQWTPHVPGPESIACGGPDWHGPASAVSRGTVFV